MSIKDVSTEEIYLYCLQKKKIDPEIVYNNLTLNNELKLTYETLYQYLSNIVTFENNLAKKEIYTYEDILELKIEGNHIVKTPIGIKLIINDINYHYGVDPYSVTLYDEVLLDNAVNMLTTK